MPVAIARVLLGAALFTIALARVAAADEILFTNGDRLTGKILSGAGGKLTVKTDVVGTVTVDMARVKTFRTDAPVTLRVGETTLLNSVVSPGPDGTIQAGVAPEAPQRAILLSDIVQINPPPPRWRGSVAVSGLATTGNSETLSVGVAANAARRAEHDRISLAGGYYYGRQTDPNTDAEVTTVNYAFGFGKYDYFFTRQFYGFGAVRAERDEIADLRLRFTPSVGAGRQWYEGPLFNLSTEGGLAWVYELYSRHRSDDHFSARIAYHVDWRPAQPILLFHNMEWLPSLEDPLGDYNLNADAGLRATILGNFFSEFKVEFRYDATPAAGNRKDDLRYLLSLGWWF